MSGDFSRRWIWSSGTAQGDWFYTSEDFESVSFENAPIDDSILDDAVNEAKMTAGFPSVFQAYTVDL